VNQESGCSFAGAFSLRQAEALGSSPRAYLARR
jgi:hypothetical protein